MWVQKLNEMIVSAKDVTILPVFISGGPYAEDRESRLRTRVAVVSGLGRAHYVPEDGEHVGYVTIDHWPRTVVGGAGGAVKPQYIQSQFTRREEGEATTQPSLSLRVPFEWWRLMALANDRKTGSDDQRPATVLVLWIRDEATADFPLRRLALLLEELKKNGLAREWPPNINARVHILGPNRSGTLRAMVLEAAGANPAVIREQLRGTKFFSSSATAADNVLTLNSLGEPRSAEQTIFDGTGATIVRTLATDDMLCDLLLEELRLRGVDVRGKKAAIALVSEWDTLYGRALPLTFGARTRLIAPGKPGLVPTTNDRDMDRELNRLVNDPGGVTNFGIYRSSYLRGIDGMVPGEQPIRHLESKSDPKDLELATVPKESPEGLDQADYLRRLANVLIQRDLWLKRQSCNDLPGAGRGLAAVGVVGSDVYDKLMVLKALRPKLPGAIFFTTDLDARLAHPSEWRQTHNLIIASAFGLQLRPDLQLDIPPFRDSYQTSEFFATLMALGVLGQPADMPPPARVFEIARSGSWDLSPAMSAPVGTNQPLKVRFATDAHEPSTASSECRSDLSNDDGVHPAPPYEMSWWISRPKQWLTAAIFWIVAISLMLFHYRSLGREKPATIRDLFKSPWPILILAIPVIVLVILVLSHIQMRSNEPLALFEGISIWPTEALRMLAACLGLFFLAKASFDLRDNAIEIEKKLLDWSARPRVKSPLRPWGTLRAWKLVGRVDARRLWRRYLSFETGHARKRRILLLSTAYIAAVIPLFMIFGTPHVPYRGPIAFYTDQFVLFAAGLIQVVLIFFVVDASRLCQRLMNNLSQGPTKWPPAVIGEYTLLTGIDRVDLEGYLDLQLLGRRTESVGKLILYPFIVLLIMIIARLPHFDNWDWPISLIAVFLLNFLYAIYCQWILSAAARDARATTLATLRDRLLTLSPATNAIRIQGIQRALSDIDNLQMGSFAPITQQPLATVLLSTAGLAIWQMIASLVLKV